MAENENFFNQLQEALNHKVEWFNTIRLQELLGQYRILQTCVKNLYDLLVKKTLIIPDPYRLDKKISDITVPATSSFPENEAMSVLGSRFSEYEVMLDFICTYFRFSVENMSISTVKKLIEFGDVFDWENLSTNSSKSNTRALATVLIAAKSNAPSVMVSMIADNMDKCAESSNSIGKILKELGVFQKELYKAELRNDLIEHPEFNKQAAMVSVEAELAEIKRLYKKVMGKKPFYTDLINEIIQEDLGQDKEKRRAAILSTLTIPSASSSVKKILKTEKVSLHELLMTTVLAISATGPSLTALKNKLRENFGLLYTTKRNFFSVLKESLRKVFHLKEEEKVCLVKITDVKTGASKTEKVKVNEYMQGLLKKERIYLSIAQQSSEYDSVNSLSDDAILQFVNKNLSELQTLFTITNALDAHFKANVDVMLRAKVKGMQMELTALRNSIINANKKRGEYVAEKEEQEQMKTLGISE